VESICEKSIRIKIETIKVNQNSHPLALVRAKAHSDIHAPQVTRLSFAPSFLDIVATTVYWPPRIEGMLVVIATLDQSRRWYVLHVEPLINQGLDTGGPGVFPLGSQRTLALCRK
jgi:hypothetical protein